jgi:hypothetical protein
MGRQKKNDEILAMSRCLREIEKLDDPRAQARVAMYLGLRFTRAVDQLLPGGTDYPVTITVPKSRPENAISMPADTGPGVDVGPDDDAPDGILDEPADEGPQDEGWDISSEGSENDDDADMTEGDEEEVSI